MLKWNRFKNKFKRFIRVPYCCYMCIRYPFLYPRNRFTGLHYNNWKIIEWKKKIYQKYHLVDIDKLHPEVTYETYKGYYFYVKQTGSVIDYWNNWWAKPLCKCITFFHDYILQIFHCIPTYIEWDAVEPGWNKAFGKQYLNDLKKQLKKDKMLYSWRIMDIKEKWGCYDKETEVLTKSGWKLFSDVSMDDEFATLNSEHYLEYHKPIDIISYKYNGLLYHLENRGISLKVTPNHNLYVSKGSYFNGNKDNLKVTFPFELCTPDKYFGKDKRFLKGCNWKGQTPKEYFKIPDYTYKHTYQDKRGYEVARTYTKIGPTIEIKAFLKFLGFYIAEGYTYIKVGKNGAHISVAYNPADEEELVTELIKNIGFECSLKGNSAHFSNTPLGHWIKEHCGHKAPNKKVPEFIKNLPSEYIKIFLEYLYIGDGYKAKTSWKLTTTSKQLLDDVCELILKCGQTFSYRKILPKPSYNNITGQLINSSLISYDINWLKNKEIEIDNSKIKHTKSFIEQWENYNDMVYCVTVPNHIIYVRRNGKGVWCGNSLRLYCNYGSEELYNLISVYEDISWNTCIKCGKPATHTSKGWISPYCEECVKKDDKDKYIERGSKEEEEYENSKM